MTAELAAARDALVRTAADLTQQAAIDKARSNRNRAAILLALLMADQ
jgi:hypothetical protein